MSYKKATHILPPELLRQIQEYVDGAYLYIPRLSGRKKGWGSATATRRELQERNHQIYADHLGGMPTGRLAEKYFLSPKSIQRIVGKIKKEKG